METKKRADILKSKTYLYMTEFFSGMAVMAVELGASRLLAPYFSSSQIVWTIIIGTIMIAMAIGNIWGGRSADKDPDPDRLYKRIIIAAVWIAMIPVVGKYIIIGISGLLVVTISTNFLIIAAFLACMVIFVFPLMLLGTVTPSLAKYTTDSLEDNGRIIGTLGAYNTVGSIIGTFLPTFVTIPAVGTAITFLIFSGVLLILGLLYFISSGRGKRLCAVTMAAFVFAAAFGNSDSFAFWEKNLLYEGESVYNYLQVKDTGDSVIFSTNVLFGVQSIKMKDGGLTGMFYDYDLAGPVAAAADFSEGSLQTANGSDGLKVLMLGNGTGTFVSQCRRYFPGADLTAVEIDGKITKLAKKYFDYSSDVPTYTYDGRAFLAASDDKYDVIVIDAYQDITIPFQMSSKEFFTLVRDHLTDDGVMVVNMNMHSDEKGSINEYLEDTIASVFPESYTVDVPESTNREMYSCKSGDFAAKFATGSRTVADDELADLMTQVQYGLAAYESRGNLLTDDKAPVELLGMRMIDGLISNELGYYKDMVRENGIMSLIE